eukprot:662248-Rhodomonas_salina.2
MKCGASSGPRYPDRARYRSLRPTSTVAEAGLVRPHGRMLNADSNAMFAFASRSVATALKHAGDGHLPQLVVGRPSEKSLQIHFDAKHPKETLDIEKARVA